jgi:hypothetical protein
MSSPITDPLTIAAAEDYRRNLPQRRGRETAPIIDDFTREMMRAYIAEVIGPIPHDALAAHVALQFGDDDSAYHYFATIVARVREGARAMNQLRGAAKEEQLE